MFAQVSTQQVIDGFGLPAAIVIIVLSGVVILLYRNLAKLQDRYEQRLEQNITEAKESRDKVMEPLEKQAIMSQKIYELLLNLTNRRGK